jgi:outer membrane lipoprotein-sorting protein
LRESRKLRSTVSRPAGFTGSFKSIGLSVVLLLTGCGVSRTRVVPIEELPFPSLEASRGELIQNLEEISRSVSTLTAAVNFTASAGMLTRGEETVYRETRGFLVVERPSRIRMRGEAPLALVTVFDMVSNGERFQLNVPGQNRVFVGDTSTRATAENAILNLRPQHIMDALFVDVAQYVDSSNVLPVFYEAVDGRRSFYVFEFVDSAGDAPQVIEKLWIDRRDLRVSRKQSFGLEGVLETDVAYDLYQDVDGISFPHRILIERPAEDYSLEINFDSTQLNTPIEEGAFVIEVPRGAELIEISDAEPDQLD